MNLQHSDSFFDALTGTLRAIFTDRSILMVMVVSVVIYSFFYPTAYQQQVASERPILVVDHDLSSSSRALIRNIHNTRAVKVIGQPRSEMEAEAMIAAVAAEGYVVIPDGFEKNILRGDQGQIALYTSGAWLGRTNTIMTGLGEAITAFAQDAAVDQASFAGAATQPPFQLVQRPLFNTREGYASALITGVAELIVQQTLLMGIAMLAATRREQKGQLFLSGTQLWGVSSALMLMGFINLLYYAGFAFWIHDYPRGENLAGLLLGSALFVGAVIALGLFIASFFQTRERAYQLILVITLPCFFLSNLSWPATATPEWLVWLAKLIPSTAGINLMIKFNQQGASFAEASQEIMNLVVLIVGFGCLTWWRYRQLNRTI